MTTRRSVNDQFVCGSASSVTITHSTSGFSTEAADKKCSSVRSHVTDATVL